MKFYHVEITKDALQDMEDIYEYSATELAAPENAMGQYDRIAEAILGLDIFPEKYKMLEFEPEKTRGMRRMTVDNYSVFYVIRDQQVIVTNVLYSASNIETRLKGD